jgi:REP element-mobilizing transposase RayT
MGRKQRVEIPGFPYHVTARRVDRTLLFVDEEDYRCYVTLLAKTVERFGWVLLSFSLMPNHIHLLIELREPNLGKGMHWLQKSYARYFNDRHDRSGRLFEHRYDPKLVTDDLYLVTVVAYIEQNPVKARLCATPEEWPWSSRGIAARGHAPWLADDLLRERRRAARGT